MLPFTPLSGLKDVKVCCLINFLSPACNSHENDHFVKSLFSQTIGLYKRYHCQWLAAPHCVTFVNTEASLLSDPSMHKMTIDMRVAVERGRLVGMLSFNGKK